MKCFFFFALGIFTASAPLTWVIIKQDEILHRMQITVAESLEVVKQGRDAIAETIVIMDDIRDEFIPKIKENPIKQRFKISGGRSIINGPDSVKLCGKNITRSECEKNGK